MTYTSCMSPDIAQGNPAWEQELDSLLMAYESESFTRSILHVYTRDCPVAVERLLSTLKAGDLEQARNAIHSLTNIMGVIGPISSRSLIDAISADVKSGQLESAARQAKELEAMVKVFLIIIQTWIEDCLGNEDSTSKGAKGTT